MNRYQHLRKQISPNKFNRIFNSNLDKAGVATVYKSHDLGFVNSFQAVEVDGIVYAVFPTKKQKGNRLETYAVKYKKDQPLDHVMFMQYPKHVIKNVEF